MLVATLVTGLSANAFAYDSPWVGVGLWVTVAVALHTAFAARTVPWIPGVIALVALGQWVMAAWVGYHVPPPVYTLAMALPADEFFRYAVPASVLFVLGLYLPLWRLGRRAPRRVTPILPPDFVRTCDIMIGVGVIASIAQSFGIPFTLRYAVVLIEYLAFVGALGLTLARADGWGWRLGGVLALRAVLSTSDGMFQELLLWTGLLACIARVRAAVARPNSRGDHGTRNNRHGSLERDQARLPPPTGGKRGPFCGRAAGCVGARLRQPDG